MDRSHERNRRQGRNRSGQYGGHFGTQGGEYQGDFEHVDYGDVDPGYEHYPIAPEDYMDHEYDSDSRRRRRELGPGNRRLGRLSAAHNQQHYGDNTDRRGQSSPQPERRAFYGNTSEYPASSSPNYGRDTHDEIYQHGEENDRPIRHDNVFLQRPAGYGERSGHWMDSKSGTGGSVRRGRGPKNWKRSDDRITEEINERLTYESDVDAHEVEVSVKDGEVTLTGTVRERHAKRMIEDIAEAVNGVTDVQNQLRIRREPTSEQSTMTQANETRSMAGTTASTSERTDVTSG